MTTVAGIQRAQTGDKGGRSIAPGRTASHIAAVSGSRRTIFPPSRATLGPVRLRDLTAPAIEAAVAEMRKMKPRRGSPNCVYCAKTINNTLTTLAVILGTAVADGLLTENPCTRPGGAGGRRLRADLRVSSSCDPDVHADLAGGARARRPSHLRAARPGPRTSTRGWG
jgi:hypothetical protein